MSKKIKVRNRHNGRVGYTIPDMNNLHRNYQPGETKIVDEQEILSLRNTPGGEYILFNYLVVEDEEVREDVVGDVEPEYFYTEADVKRLLLEGSADELEDCLNFAPIGVISLVKDLAVTLPCNDIVKRDLIFKKTGFNVSAAIELTKDDEEELGKTEVPVRKATAPTVKKVVRKAATPKKAE